MSSTLNATARIHTQAARNVNDGISFLNVADGATSALKDILFRLRELSTQSSNGTLSNPQRQSLDKEAQGLQAEYGRILDTTSFNGIRVFGSGDVVVQAGVGTEAALLVKLSLGSTSSVIVATGDGTFQAKQSFSTGVTSQPHGLALADFDADGKLDTAVANYNSSVMGVLLGNGNGTLQGVQQFGYGFGPQALAAADFNGDGKPDFVSSDSGNTASVYLGNGNGTFQSQMDFDTGSAPYSVVAGDLNGDGKVDLATGDWAGSTASVLLGNGNGTFQAKQSYATGFGTRSVSVADFNSDGKADLMTSGDGEYTFSILLGNGNGTFQARQAIPVNDPNRATVADVNGDGKTDVIASRAGSVAVLLGNGNGTFQGEKYFDTGSAPYSVVAGDLNGDGKVDLAAANLNDDTVSVLLGNGNGTFQAKHTLGTGNTPWTIALGDLDGDGVNDLVTANAGSNTVSVLVGNGTMTMTTTTTVGGLQPITGVSLATQEDALLAQGQIDGYLDTVNKVSGTIGTALSRFQIAAHVASSVADVSQAAEARITDADVAENSAGLVRNQILQQAASAVLAQANQQPALALTLLRD